MSVHKTQGQRLPKNLFLRNIFIVSLSLFSKYIKCLKSECLNSELFWNPNFVFGFQTHSDQNGNESITFCSDFRQCLKFNCLATKHLLSVWNLAQISDTYYKFLLKLILGQVHCAESRALKSRAPHQPIIKFLFN